MIPATMVLVAELPSDIDRDLGVLEAELRRLEAEYNMFFAGRLPRPPWETRSRVADRLKRLDRTAITNYGQKFRFLTIQSRFSTFVDLWDRGLKAREEGRRGPLDHGRSSARTDRTLHVATVADPAQDTETLRELYQRVADARRELGQESIPFSKFTDLVRTQVNAFKEKGNSEVAFRVAMKDGKVAFTARALKRAPREKT
jgi:hypothetical protein